MKAASAALPHRHHADDGRPDADHRAGGAVSVETTISHSDADRVDTSDLQSVRVLCVWLELAVLPTLIRRSGSVDPMTALRLLVPCLPSTKRKLVRNHFLSLAFAELPGSYSQRIKQLVFDIEKYRPGGPVTDVLSAALALAELFDGGDRCAHRTKPGFIGRTQLYKLFPASQFGDHEDATD